MVVRRRIDDIRIGGELPPIEMEITLTSLVMYAAATWDFHRYHYDQRFVADAGMAAPFMDGQMAGALMARQLMSWAGPDAFVRRLSFRLRNMVFAGERIVLGATVGGITRAQGVASVDLRQSIVKADGTEVVRDAAATVEMPA